jgi:putative radical SAM enzyme (TIGR03279 family)
MAHPGNKKHGVIICGIDRTSPFFAAGLRIGDRIVGINNEPVTDELDFHYSAAHDRLRVEAVRAEEKVVFDVHRDEGCASGVTLAEQPIHRCANRCVFCFIDQMPPGLRRSLYIKDEDIRLSLFNGNYLTMSTFRTRDIERIVRLGLSPLYISVHATDPEVRRRMLRNAKMPDVTDQLAALAAGGIRFHTQIVVCPGFNDGRVLSRSLRELLAFGESLLSVAVVPVGLTRFHENGLRQVDEAAAATHDGFRKVFLADEFLIKAGLPIPPRAYYGDYPQIENGVGIVRQFIDAWQSSKRKLRREGVRRIRRSMLVATSVSAYPFVAKAVKEFAELFVEGEVATVAVENRLCGSMVTVAGLLSAGDIISHLRPMLRRSTCDEVVVPSVMFNFAGYTLDGFSPERLGRRLGIPVRVIDSMEDLLK